MSALLTVRGLSAGYGPIEVLHGVDLDVQEGQVAVILGANGAGKTTTLRAISGMIPRAGVVDFNGQSIIKTAPERIVSLGVAHVAHRHHSVGARHAEREVEAMAVRVDLPRQPRHALALLRRQRMGRSDSSGRWNCHQDCRD